MADRIQLANVPPPDPKLTNLMATARKPTEHELREQRISFAFGNAPARAKTITKQTVRCTASRIGTGD